MKPEDLFKFYAEASKLKLVLRHCWLGDEKRAESVADHTWGIMLLAILIIPQLDTKIDTLKVLKMLAFHDLAEATTGDIPATEKETMNHKEVQDREIIELKRIVSHLDKKQAQEILELCEEFNEEKTTEALFANAMDKAEAIMQHDFTDLDTWEEREYSMNTNYKDHFFNFDPKIRKLKDFINHYNYWLIYKAGKQDKLTPEQREYWEKNKDKYKFEVYG